ncbi:hypothetical protein [Pyrolobus fumarii]|nr:hypothetical protein [Pyrolobus fumarii]
MLGDYYRVLGIAEQPKVEHGPNGVLYYWFEVFRRATLTPSKFPCWHITLDVYVEGYPGICITRMNNIVSINDSRIHYCDLSMLLRPVCSHINNAWIEILEVEGSIETISIHIDICGFAEPPPYELVEAIHNAATMLIERRDPRSTPLWIDVKHLMQYKRA